MLCVRQTITKKRERQVERMKGSKKDIENVWHIKIIASAQNNFQFSLDQMNKIDYSPGFTDE